MTDPDPTPPPPESIPARWGAHEGAVVDVTGFVPPAPIPMERQVAWGEAFRKRPLRQLSIIDRMALKAGLDKGGPLLGGFQQWIVELEGQGFTPESWVAALPSKAAEEEPQPGRVFVVVPTSGTSDRIAREVARDLVAATPAPRRLVLDLTVTFPGTHPWSVRRIAGALDTSTPAEVAPKLIAHRWFSPRVIEGRHSDLVESGRAPGFSTLLEELTAAHLDVVVCAPATGLADDDPLRGFAELPNSVVLACSDDYAAMTESEFRALQRLAAATGGEFRALAHTWPATEDDLDGVSGPVPRHDVEVHPVDLSNRYAASDGFALLREWFGLRVHTLPEGLDPAVERELVDCFADEGLELPYVPDDVAESVVRTERGTFTTGNWDVPAEAAYMFRPAVDAVLEDWQPRLAVTIGGHGSNSYAWTYVLVAHGVAVVAQAHRGLAYADMGHTDRSWSTLLAGARRVHEAAESLDIPVDRMMLVEWSPLRGVSRWRLLGRFDDAPDGWGAVDTRDFGTDRSDAVFRSAVQDGLRILATP